jgi:hypothetical protein
LGDIAMAPPPKPLTGRAMTINPQTRSVLKATLIGLAVSIVVTAITVLPEGRLDPIEPYQIFNAGVIAHWVGRVGFIPLIFAVGAIAFSIRKTPIWISVSNLAGAVVGIALGVAIGVVAVAAAYPVAEFPFATGADRDAFMKKAMPSCIRKQRSLPENHNVSDDAINAFCSCYTDGVAGSITREDMQYQAKYDTMSADLEDKLTAAHIRCVQTTRK